jgi:heme-degrading monooxygenase HmoA
MNARVITVQWKMDRLEEATRFFRDKVAPALKVQPGFANTRMLVDHSTGQGMMVTVWESAAALQASETNGFLREQLTHLSQFFATAPTVMRYEITVNA